MSRTSLRSHTCGQLRIENKDLEVKLCGWIQSRRDHGGIIFIDLRDRAGITQIVLDPKTTPQDAFKQAETLRREDCITITGKVRPRGESLENPKLGTGKIEIIVSALEIFSKSETPPFEIEDGKDINDDIRLQYRYLDLRRPQMQRNIAMRSKAAQAARKFLSEEQDFSEIETPMLMKSTPEGARDYVVPSRVNPGKFYALPQSPQIYKQLLMVSGCDRYYQFAKCFRDEDLRADRQPEFTQIDLEMTFVEQNDVFSVIEGTTKAICTAFGVDCPTPFDRLTYEESMKKYSTDKPDRRFDMFTHNITHIAEKSDFSVFKNVIASGGIVKCINPTTDIGRKDIDRYITYAQEFGAKGMAWMRVADGKLESNIAKYFSEDVQKELVSFIQAQDNSIVMCIADEVNTCNDVISRLRLKVADDLGLIDKSKFNFVWITDYPLFEKNADSPTGWSPAHHMFTMPKKDTIQYLESAPQKVYADCYDLVLNGVELGSGSIRCHLPALQKQIMNLVGFAEEDAEERFGFLIKSFQYGAPPHGGFAIGFDRLVALLSGTSDIREVIAFPKNKHAQNPMDGSPSAISEQQLKELHINVTKK